MHRAILLLSMLSILAACSQPPVNRIGETAPQTEQSVDLMRYQGLWYEIARYPNSFEEGCEGVTAEYKVREDGKVDVTNICRQGSPDGPVDVAEGVARVVDEATNAKLKVKFAPAWVPFASGDYWILHLAEDYSHVLVGSPDGRYLWILARSPALPDETLAAIKEEAEKRGYDPAALRMTEQPPG